MQVKRGAPALATIPIDAYSLAPRPPLQIWRARKGQALVIGAPSGLGRELVVLGDGTTNVRVCISATNWGSRKDVG
jgi:hypothetical protein